MLYKTTLKFLGVRITAINLFEVNLETLKLPMVLP